MAKARMIALTVQRDKSANGQGQSIKADKSLAGSFKTASPTLPCC